MKKRAKNFVVVVEHEDGAHFCHGIYKTAAEAYGNAMLDIWDFANSYMDEGDIFEIGKPEDMDGDAGYVISVKYKKYHWTHIEKPYEEYYYVLFEGETEEND